MSSPSRISPGAARSASRPAAVIAAPVAIVAPRGPLPRKTSPDSSPRRSCAVAVAQLDRRPRRAQRVVAVGLGQAEDADEPVTEVALDAAAVLLDHRAPALEPSMQDLGIGDLRPRREHRDEAARPRRRRRRRCGPVGRRVGPGPGLGGAQRGERRDHRGGRRGAPLGRLGEQLHDQPLERGRHLRGMVRRRHRRHREVLGEHVRRVVGGERGTPGHQLVEGDAERIQIARGADLVAADLLGGEIAHRADDDPLGGQAVGALELGDAEVAERGRAVGGQPDVVGLDVTVHDPVCVGVRQRGRDLAADAQDVGRSRPLARQHRGQRPAAHRP